MVLMAEKLTEKQEEFARLGIDAHVDLGFHCTIDSYMEKIKLNGLMSRKERRTRKQDDHKNGEMFGNGIYTGNNPLAFQRYGPIGIIVARLKGTCSQRLSNLSAATSNHGCNTLIGKKVLDQDPDGYYDEVVLQGSAQVIPLVCYNKPAVRHAIRQLQLG